MLGKGVQKIKSDRKPQHHHFVQETRESITKANNTEHASPSGRHQHLTKALTGGAAPNPTAADTTPQTIPTKANCQQPYPSSPETLLEQAYYEQQRIAFRNTALEIKEIFLSQRILALETELEKTHIINESAVQNIRALQAELALANRNNDSLHAENQNLMQGNYYLQSLQTENDWLRGLNQNLMQRNNYLETLQTDNDRLRGLNESLNLVLNMIMPAIANKQIAKQTTPVEQTAVINEPEARQAPVSNDGASVSAVVAPTYAMSRPASPEFNVDLFFNEEGFDEMWNPSLGHKP